MGPNRSHVSAGAGLSPPSARCAPNGDIAGFLFQLRHLTLDSRRAPYDTGLRDLLRVVRDKRARAAAVPPVRTIVGGPITPTVGR